MKRLLSTLIAGALLLAACGGDSGDSEESTTNQGEQTTGSETTGPQATTTTGDDTSDLSFRACDLVSDDDVESYLGVEVTGEPGPLADAGNSLIDDCFWQSSESFENFSIQVFGDRALADSDFGDLFDVESYPGIGEEAITLADDTGRFNSIWVQANGYTLACYPDQFTDVAVEVDGQGWDVFLPVCRKAVESASR